MKTHEVYQQLWNYYNQYQITQILEKETGLSKSQLFLCETIKSINIDTYIKLAKEKIPFEYIIQKAEFFWYNFHVDSRVLIPRNDTEIMVQEAIKVKESDIYIDVGTGSWCIALSLVNTQQYQQAYGIDISADAIEVAKMNQSNFSPNSPIEFIRGNLLESFLDKNLSWKHLLITANLPYIKTHDYENMDKETIKYEPDLALYGWKTTWFELYEKLIEQCLFLKNNNKHSYITLFIEIWFDQKKYSQQYLNAKKIQHIYFQDNWWIERCIKIEL